MSKPPSYLFAWLAMQSSAVDNLTPENSRTYHRKPATDTELENLPRGCVPRRHSRNICFTRRSKHRFEAWVSIDANAGDVRRRQLACEIPPAA